MTHKTETEVLIIGAGPVGILTAILLADAGVDVQVIDQAEGPAMESCACGLHPRSLQLLRGVELLGPVLEDGYRVDAVAFYEGARRLAEVRLAELPIDTPFAVALPQGALERLLENRFQKSRARQILWHHRLEKLEPHGDGFATTIARLGTDSKGYAVPGVESVVRSEFTTHARFVIGTDGPGSIVRKNLNIESESFQAGERFIICDVESGDFFGPEARVVLEEEQVGMLWPLSENSCHWILPAGPLEDPVELPAKQRLAMVVEPDELRLRFQEQLRKRAPWFGQSIKEIRCYEEVPFETRLAKQYGAGHGWIAGDAAHLGRPLGMQSMNAGLQDGALLSETLIHILRGNAPLEALDAWARSRRDEWLDLVRIGASPPPSPANPAIRKHWPQIPSCLPGLGGELRMLMTRLNSDGP